MSVPSLILERQKARWYPLKPHPVQLELIRAVDNGIRFPVVPAGRRCLEKGTLVATPKGPVAIEDLKVGDQVIGFENDKCSITTVSAVFNNGKQKVTALCSSNKKYVAATDNHNFWACEERHIGRYKRYPVTTIGRQYRIRREFAYNLIEGGDRDVPLAYALAAFLGDGNCRNNNASTGQYQRTLHISAASDEIPAKIAELLNCSYRVPIYNNFNYIIDVGLGAQDKIPYYKEWCHDLYAHQKQADWEEIDTWNKESCLKFLAGIIDTDGSIHYKDSSMNQATIAIGMQAFNVIDACQKIIHKYFQEDLAISIDNKEKYKNGPIYYVKITSNLLIKRILTAINQYLVAKKDFPILTLDERNYLSNRIGLLKVESYEADTFDITVDNSTNLYCLHNGGIITSNSGKTERGKRFLARRSMYQAGEKFFAGAPTFAQAKKIWWQDLKDLTFSCLHPKKPTETDLQIFLPNGTEIHIIGFDQPQRFEGVPWTGGIIDEIADVKEQAVIENILPALNTVDPRRPDYRAWCWFIGVPEGLGHYKDMADLGMSGRDPNYKTFHWKSAEILPEDVIEGARRTMSARQFRQEYEASFETAGGRVYEDYCHENWTTETINPREELHWTHDQNFTPLSSAIVVIRNGIPLFLDEIILDHAISRQSALEFVDRYRSHQNKMVYIYGDPAGRAGEKHGHKSDYDEIEEVLRLNNWKYERRVRYKHPSIKNRQNAVRAKIKNAKNVISLYVNPETAKWCDKGLSTVQLKEGSTFIEDQTNQYQHITTAIGYFVDYIWPSGQIITTSGVISGNF